ncbi:MAG: ABC transporter permease [Clostridiales bacterium]|jgi:spermidine/putrescine transport system permease protein|nr:ABC transporter permease [Eubacteriales bacterium]MDH7565690.1 ABC transporter permease [Clostridiales bacterium]
MAKKIIGWFYSIIILIFFYAPVAVLMAMSFNKSRYGALPFEFSTEWYRVLFSNQKLIQAALDSLAIAAVTAVLCVVLGTAMMLGQREFNSRVKAFFNSLVVFPLVIPWIILGLSLLLLLRALGLDRNYAMLLIGHVVVSFPYAVMVIGARLEDMNSEIQEASYNLGANEWTTFKRITLPMLSPAMLAGGFLAFMISFDNFVLSYFLIPTGKTTLPIEIYSSIKFGFTPEINAISSIILAATLLMITVIAVLMRSSLMRMFK